MREQGAGFSDDERISSVVVFVFYVQFVKNTVTFYTLQNHKPLFYDGDYLNLT